jgi:mercuric ion transport protein
VSPNELAPTQATGAPTSRTASSAAFATAGVASAFLATGCCVGPFLLAAFGLSGGGLIVRLEPYRPYLAAASAFLIASAIANTYRRPRPEMSGCRCVRPARPSPVVVVVVWIGTAVAAALLVAAYVAERFAHVGLR